MQRTHLLAPGLVVLLTGTLALAACNSSSISGNQSNAPKATNAETKSPPAPKGSPSKGLIDAAIAQIR